MVSPHKAKHLHLERTVVTVYTTLPNIQISAFCPYGELCCIRCSQKTAIISLRNISRVALTMTAQCTICAVGTTFLHSVLYVVRATSVTTGQRSRYVKFNTENKECKLHLKLRIIHPCILNFRHRASSI